MKVTPITRPDTLLALQPWSTATSQTAESRIAPAPIAFINMERNSDHQQIDRLT